MINGSYSCEKIGALTCLMRKKREMDKQVKEKEKSEIRKMKLELKCIRETEIELHDEP